MPHEDLLSLFKHSFFSFAIGMPRKKGVGWEAPDHFTLIIDHLTLRIELGKRWRGENQKK